MLVECKFVEGKPYYDVVRPRIPMIHPQSKYHNVLGTIVFGDRGFIPAAYAKALAKGIPTITLHEKYVDGVAIPANCSFSFRPWTVSEHGLANEN